MANTKKEQSRLTDDALPPDRMPTFKAKDKVLLMIMLTEFTEQREKELVSFLQYEPGVIDRGIEVKTWTPSKCLLDSIALQGPHRDSLANIYALAMLAYMSGLEFILHTSFVVADDLTKRCWEGTHRVGERGRLSLLMVKVRPDLTEDTSTSVSSLPLEFCVMVSRFSDTSDSPHRDGNSDFIDFGDSYSSSAEERKPTGSHYGSSPFVDDLGYGLLPFILEKFCWQSHDDVLRPDYHCRVSKVYRMVNYGTEGIDQPYSVIFHGMYLHDPDREMFSIKSTLMSTRKRYLKAAWSVLSSRLPPELSTEIISRADLVPSFRAHLWKYRQSREHLHIFLMFPTTEDELREAHLVIHDALQKRSREEKNAPKTAELIPFHRHGMRTRRDVVAFWKEYQMHEPDERCNDPVLNLMLNPIQKSTANVSHFAIVYSGGARPVIALRTTLSTLGTLSTSDLFDLSARDCDEYSIDLVEAAYDPDQPHYHNPPVWEAVGNSLTDQYLHDYGSISVFYLTKHLRDSEDLILRKEIHKVDGEDRYDIDPDDDMDYYWDQRKDVCFVPWECDEDGTLEDIWNLVLKIYKHEGFGRRFQRFFCLDRQSVEDQTLIIVEPDFFLSGRKVQDEGELLQGMVAPTLAGFRCNRVLCEEAHESKIELDQCIRTIEEIGGLDNEGQHFIRPDWPGPEVLPPTNPWRLGWPEPSQPPVWDIFGSRLDAVNDENEERE
ncbi:hypothetical protein N7507_001240 [Penicillium longicatenatum]|nr:hypothetical protein N7507_001240 [Penicillium longicatenatum]